MPTESSRVTSAAVERQMRNWELARQQAQQLPDTEQPLVKPFVTISRMVGSGGATVARQLAQKVGWPLFDREVLQFMAGDDSVRERLYETMDERDVSFIEELMRGFGSTEIMRNDYFHRLTATILAIARQGHAIFLGRAADLILPRALGIRVRVVSLAVTCAQRYAERNGVSVVQAARDVERIERERHQFTSRHFNIAPDSPDRYDLVMNLAALTQEEAVHILMELMRLRHMMP